MKNSKILEYRKFPLLKALISVKTRQKHAKIRSVCRQFNSLDFTEKIKVVIPTVPSLGNVEELEDLDLNLSIGNILR